MKIVITHNEMGVYLGTALGLGFWTLLDPAGQPSAVTFNSVQDAREHVATWDDNNDPDVYSYVPICTDMTFATIPELIAAGLEPLLGNMQEDYLRYATVESSFLN